MLERLRKELVGETKAPVKAPSNAPDDLLRYDLEGLEKYWTADYDGEAILQKSETGFGAYNAETLPQILEKAVKKNGDKIFLRTENMPPLAKGESIPAPIDRNDWASTTYAEFMTQSRNAAKAMIACGFSPHDACNIFGFNSPEWFVGMYGAILAAGKAAGIYPSDTADQVQFKSDHSNGSIAFIETAENLEKFKSKANELPYLKAIVTWACDAGEDIARADGSTIKTYNYSEFVMLGEGEDDQELENRLEGIKPSNCCALIYTSGTTGNPKAVMITHDNLYYEAMAVMKGCIKVVGDKNEEERIISYLPLSHIAGMMVDSVCPILISSCLEGWCSVHFARSYDLKKSSIGDRLKSVQPTLFFGVPRVWEKIMEKLLAVGAAMPDNLVKKISTAAKAASLEHQKNAQLGGSGEKPLSLYVYNLLLNQIKAKLGLDKAKFVFAGAAPMTKECLEYFGSIGFNINEVYGMSECTGACTWSNDQYHTWGSVGYELPGTEVKIFKVDPVTGEKSECPPAKDLFSPTEEEQGEICFRGRGIMMGYMANERLGEDHINAIEKKNMDAIDAEGWLHSGDKGTKDTHGMVKITGRYKELIIGAGGENIAPVPIEDEMKKLCPYISNIMMIGNKRKYNVCVITLKAVGATGELPGGDELDGAAAVLSDASTISEAMGNDVFIQSITKALKQVNNNPKVCPSSAAKIQKFTILPRDFSVQTGELTATLKLKRSVVDDKYQEVIDKMYGTSGDVYVPFDA
mmetsp:Transcript_5033/g.6562  ORF Transcript_5033/g.6562 Transcript_5033/m.6562 type:complete len:749 (+) Transcript_5033:191-2437(+)|eukprot:CAMPEP_0204872400 /NCGR_PEP_ID=MMETSP1348-20121228/38191_1 /ASSEMBLY_ACC=CAM_ASM_000700 /TAXON_ID=215587 /ORGANISM="Aplanochytrium stocchinoi, Strain GSBS06" /LENGTH=748 /DNA_ID=CAMNT_0052027269 /DNA_START=86 /DNA_END=2332 /DNA_ORIENTATION=-